MQPIPVLSAVAIVAAAFSEAGSRSSDVDEDGPLWDAIVSGQDVLLGVTFREAVLCHPLRVESLVTQRVFRPFLLLCMRLVRPWVTVSSIDAELRSAWMSRNRSLRSAGMSVRSLADADASSWRQNSRMLVDAMSVPSAEVGRVRAVMASRRPDIHRAFEECRTLLDEASCTSGTDGFGWLVLKSVVEDMESVVLRVIDGQTLEGAADIGPDVGLMLEAAEAPSSSGYAGDADRFGAVSIGEGDEDGDFRVPDSFGYHGVHEEFLVSGHRAPSVGLSQYRRMGGRVF